MRAEDPGEAARALAFGRVKVCGITDGHDAAMAGGARRRLCRASSWCRTRRAPSPARRREAIAEASPVPLVGVFRNEKPMQVAYGARALGLQRGPAPRRRGRALHKGAARPAAGGDRDLGRGGGRPRGAPAAAGRRPHPVRQPGRRPLGRHRNCLRLVAARGPGRPRPVAARRRPEAVQRAAPRPGSAPSRSTSARASRWRRAARMPASSTPSSRRCGCRSRGEATCA